MELKTGDRKRDSGGGKKSVDILWQFQLDTLYTAIEFWNIVKYVIESITDDFFPWKNKVNGLERSIFQKKLLEK